MISDHCILRPGQPTRVFLTKADRDQAQRLDLAQLERMSKPAYRHKTALAAELAERSRMLEVMDGD